MWMKDKTEGPVGYFFIKIEYSSGFLTYMFTEFKFDFCYRLNLFKWYYIMKWLQPNHFEQVMKVIKNEQIFFLNS